MTAIAGLRGTGQFDSNQRPTNYRELFTLLEPNGTAPLNALLAMTASEATDDPKYNHFRDELPSRVVTVDNGAGYNAAAATIVVDATDDVNFLVPGVTLYNVRTGEQMLVTAMPAGGTQLTVQRNIGGTTFTISDNDVLAVSGFADKEGGNAPEAVSFDPTTEYNYTQIFKTAVGLTNTLANTKLRTGSKEQEQITKALKLHMADIERAMFFGRRHIDNPNSANPTRFTGGLFSQITNVIDGATGFAAADTITEKEFDRMLIENIFAYGSTEKLAFVGPRAASNFMEIAKNRWQPTAVSGSYGVTMSRYSTFAGDLLMHLHPMFRQIPGFEDAVVILDLPNVKYRYLQNRDTQLKKDVQAPDADGKKHYYLTECGLELTQSKVHAVIRNWKKVS